MPSFVHDAHHKNFEYREPHDRLQDGLAALRRGQFDRPVLGVDLGSHASRVGVVVGGRVELCGGVLPSRVARVDGAWVVGAAADAAANAESPLVAARREGGCGGDGLDAKLWDAAKAGLRGACAPAACSDAAGVASVRKAREALGRLEAAVLDVAPWTLDRETLEDAGREVAADVAAAARRALRTAGLAAADSVVVAGGAASAPGLRDALAPLGALRPPGKFAPADAVAVGATRFAERLLRRDGAALETAYLDEGVACVAPAVPAPPAPPLAPTAADHTAAYYKKWDAFDPSDSDDENTTTPGIDIQTGSPRPKARETVYVDMSVPSPADVDIYLDEGERVAGRKPRPKGEPPETPPEPPPRTTGRRKKPTWREVATRPF
ncbi:ATP binding protein [Aureococcus anophagefferens]|uniref:ATP binding protein n=1 Tax=Aureococcus anophagefferens TaxID=44056 RepID=A0ABR1GEE8_AURAN